MDEAAAQQSAEARIARAMTAGLDLRDHIRSDGVWSGAVSQQASAIRLPTITTTTTASGDQLLQPPQPLLQPQMADAGSTGLSQPTANLHLSAPPGLADEAMGTATVGAFQLRRELQEHMELLMVEDSDIIAAHRQVHTHLPVPDITAISTTDATTTVTQLRDFLRACAFDPTSSSPYAALGYSELDGPLPTRVTLERRFRFAEQVTRHFTTDDNHADLETLLLPLQVACDRCIDHLPDMERKRKLIKGAPKTTPHWLELGPEALESLVDFRLSGTASPPHLATQLSNVLHQDWRQTHQVIDVQTTRLLYGKLNGSTPAVMEQTLSDMTTPTITWCPDPSQAPKVAATFQQLQAQGRGPTRLGLLATFDAYPGCTEARHLLDLWQHPLLSYKWRETIVAVDLVHPPALVVVTGPSGPLHVRKGIAIITLGTAATPAIPRLLGWADTYFIHSTHQTIWLDMPHIFRWQVYGLIASFQLPGFLTADKPRPSLGNRSTDQRSNIKVHFDNRMGNALMQDVISGWLRKTLAPYTAIVGLQSTMSSDTAKLLDISSTTGAYLLSDLASSTIIVSPRLALVDSTTEHKTWEGRMTTLWNRDPTNTGLRLRLRDSHPSRSKKCAEVGATREQIQSASCRRGHEEVEPTTEKPETLRAFLDVPVNTEAQLSTWLPRLMQQISTDSQVRLSHHTDEQGMAMNSWREVCNFEGAWTGRILIQCSRKEELFQIHRLIHHKGITIQGHTTTASLLSHYIDLDTQL